MKPRPSHLGSIRNHSAIARTVAGLLLVFVIYGTTIEAAHRHGRIFALEQSKSTSVQGHDKTGDIAGNSLSCAECLICQLHQHFSASLVTVRDDDANAVAIIEGLRSAAAAIPSRSTAPRSGRAPPLTS